MKNKVDFVKEWFEKADNDLLSIENNLKADKVPADVVCFHAQQSVEKYLKGYLIMDDIIFKQSHDLVYLIELVMQKEGSFLQFRDNINELNDYAVQVRYPFFYNPTLEDAQKSYKIAIEIKKFVLNLLKNKL